MVVDPTSADPGIAGVIPRPIDADHATICKPRSRDDVLCAYVANVVRSVLTATPSKAALRDVDQLPADLPDFRGRIEQIDELKAILTGGGSAAVTAIGGKGGVGKSVLALHVAHHLADAAPDGRLFVDMGGTSVRPLSPVDAMARVVAALDPSAEIPNEPDHMVQAYRKALTSKRVLLLFDNAENAAQMRPLLEGRTPGTMILVTSRRALSLPGLKTIDLEVMTSSEARALLRSILGDRQADDGELDLLAQSVGRLPLALGIAGSFLARNQNWPISRYIAALIHEKKQFERPELEDDARPDVYGALTMSINQLLGENVELAKRWHMLAPFQTSFDAVAASEIWNCSPDEALNDLNHLAQFGLLYRRGEDRFRLHRLMRELGARLDPEGLGTDSRSPIAPLAGSRSTGRKIFLSYAKEDRDKVEAIYDHLANEGFCPWMDKRDILPGQAWQNEIQRAIGSADYCLVFLSELSVNKKGYVRKEFKMVAEMLDQMPDESIYVIPIRLDECEPPEFFSKLQWIDLFQDKELERILLSLRTR